MVYWLAEFGYHALLHVLLHDMQILFCALKLPGEKYALTLRVTLRK